MTDTTPARVSRRAAERAVVVTSENASSPHATSGSISVGPRGSLGPFTPVNPVTPVAPFTPFAPFASNGWPPRAALVVAIAAVFAKLALALLTFGTNDVAAWMEFAWVIHQKGGAFAYLKVSEFNHPPFIVHLLQLMGWLADRNWLPFQFWMRLPAILADFGSFLVVYRIFAMRQGGPADRFSLVWLAAAPISLFVSGFHGNTDPVMVFFLLVAVMWIDTPRGIGLAGAAFGMALNIKVVALAFAPAAFFYLPSWSRRMKFFGAAAAVVLAGSMPVLAEAPEPILHNVLGYTSIVGHWGWTRIATALAGSPGIAHAAQAYGGWVLMAVLTAIAFLMNRGEAKPSLFRQFGLVAFAFLALTPGFGIQYLAWLVPWVVGIRRPAVSAFYVATGAFMFVVYTYWSRGTWWYANSDAVGDWKGFVIPFEIAAWISVCVVLVWMARAVTEERRPAIA
jgi:hypothetical protein